MLLIGDTHFRSLTSRHKLNEMKGVLDLRCADIGLNGPGDPPEDSKFEPWQSEVEHATSWLTRLPTIEFLRASGKEFFFSLKLEGQSGVRTHNLRLSEQVALVTAPDPALAINK